MGVFVEQFAGVAEEFVNRGGGFVRPVAEAVVSPVVGDGECRAVEIDLLGRRNYFFNGLAETGLWSNNF